MRRCSRELLFVELALVLMLLCSAPAWSRPELGPPSIKLRTPLSNVVVAELSGIGEGGHAVFSKLVDLHGEAPVQFQIANAQTWVTKLRPGERYVLAYIAWTVQRFPKAKALREGGPVLISIPGAAPAILKDKPELQQLLRWDLEQSGRSPEALLPLIRAGWRVDDWQYQEFFITEITTRPSLHDVLTEEDRAELAAIALDSSSSPYVPQLLFKYGDYLGDNFSIARRVALARRVLGEQALQQNTASQYPSLLRSAMHYLQKQGSAGDVDVLARWLHSDHSGLLDTALETMLALGVEHLSERVDEALQRTLIDESSARVLRNYQRRLAAIERQRSVADER